MARPTTLHCITCDQLLLPGQEPEYFAQTSLGYSPETEVNRAVEDVSQSLRYAQAVTSVVWDMLMVADVDCGELLDKAHYLKTARELEPLLTDLVAEVDRRAQRLARLLREAEQG
jgi:hypothetical protein